MVLEDIPDGSGQEYVPAYVPEDTFTFSSHDVTTPLIAVVDTCFLRTGLSNQLTWGTPPPSLLAMQQGKVQAFMEGDTLREAIARIPRFAAQMSTSEQELRDLLVNEWLPYIRVVELPTHLRELDQRSLAVQQNDEDDYAAAALAAVLSPCVIMTHDSDFKPLSFQHYQQAILAISLIDDVNDGDASFRAVVMIPAMPLVALGKGVKYTYDRFGPMALVVLTLLLGGGTFAYYKQPKERRDALRGAAGKIGRGILEMYGEATADAQRARLALSQKLVPPSKDPHPFVSVLRTLATTSTSLSAQQLHDRLSPDYSFSVPELRAYLHNYKTTTFFEARRGGFFLGLPYEVWRNGPGRTSEMSRQL